jgi:hypothetical protein
MYNQRLEMKLRLYNRNLLARTPHNKKIQVQVSKLYQQTQSLLVLKTQQQRFNQLKPKAQQQAQQ